MSRKGKGGYKPVETQSIAEPEFNASEHGVVTYQELPYEIVGNAKLSRFKTSLNLDIVENGEHKYYVIIMPHIKAILEGSVTLVHVRKYKTTEE